MGSQIVAPRPLYGWTQPTVATDWTADMLARLPDDGWRYELLEGRVLRMPSPGTDHGSLEARLSRRLGNYVEDHQLGETYVGESGWDLTRPGDLADTVLGVGIAFARAERLPCPRPAGGRPTGRLPPTSWWRLPPRPSINRRWARRRGCGSTEAFAWSGLSGRSGALSTSGCRGPRPHARSAIAINSTEGTSCPVSASRSIRSGRDRSGHGQAPARLQIVQAGRGFCA